jgi:hypothetical protein
MRIVLWTALAALGLAPVAPAQSAPASDANPPELAVAAVVSAVMPSSSLWGIVKELPFSATQTTIREQTLTDGTVIRSSVEVQLWRDSEGRMRAESTLKSKSIDAPQSHIVAVWDPIKRTEISWISGSTRANFATVLHLPELQLDGMMGALVSTPPPPGVIPRSQRTASTPAELSSPANRASSNLHTEALSQDTIAGLEVSGTRTTRVIPAGSIDNDRDFTVSSETWTSPELKIAVRQITDDPRTGKVTTELTNVDRSEPDPALFKPPAGYRLMDLQNANDANSEMKR